MKGYVLKNDDGSIGGVFPYSTANVSPGAPTDAELDAIFGQPATVGAGFIGIVNDSGGGTECYIVWSDGANWWNKNGNKSV